MISLQFDEWTKKSRKSVYILDLPLIWRVYFMKSRKLKNWIRTWLEAAKVIPMTAIFMSESPIPTVLAPFRLLAVLGVPMGEVVELSEYLLGVCLLISAFKVTLLKKVVY